LWTRKLIFEVRRRPHYSQALCGGFDHRRIFVATSISADASWVHSDVAAALRGAPL